MFRHVVRRNYPRKSREREGLALEQTDMSAHVHCLGTDGGKAKELSFRPREEVQAEPYVKR